MSSTSVSLPTPDHTIAKVVNAPVICSKTVDAKAAPENSNSKEEPLHYRVAFMTLATSFINDLTIKESGAITSKCHQEFRSQRVGFSTTSKNWFTEGVLDMLCSMAAETMLFEGKKEPERWVERTVTCIFEAGTRDPETVPPSATHHFDVLYSKRVDGKMHSKLVRIRGNSLIAPATLEFYNTFRQTVVGNEWESTVAPPITMIKLVE